MGLPTTLPRPLLELCSLLEERGISTWSHGEGLLADLRSMDSAHPTRTEPRSTRSFLCTTDPSELLNTLPRAVVTSSRARRLTLATEAGPIDLLPVGHDDLERVLLNFGLGPFAFAYRPTKKRWCDPENARETFEKGILDISTTLPDPGRTDLSDPNPLHHNPFSIAPRRYWISARLLSEYTLEPSANLLDAARAALPDARERLPLAAPARREVSRILNSTTPERGLAFLRMSGLSAAVFPGIDPAGESIVARLAPLPALQWAAWLRGSAIQSALVRLRMPPTLARRIERVLRSHPIDRRIESLREVGVRKILGRHSEEEISGLFTWRRLELATTPQTKETRNRSRRLDEIEARFVEVRSHKERSNQVRELAMDGNAVMTALGAGPGPHVGRALAHLATFVETHPGSNERDALEQELSDWAARNPDVIR